MRAIEKIREITEILSSCGIESAGKEAELMLRFGLQADSVTIYRDNPELSSHDKTAILDMVSRRSQREPLQYIIGTVDFIGLNLAVDRSVLIPRPETELMAEYAAKTVKRYELSVMSARGYAKAPNSKLRMLDLCTGSGCLALSLAKEFPQSEVTGCDNSISALTIARKNAATNNIVNVSFAEGDLFHGVKPGSEFDMIISNPPYIRSDDIQCIQPEVRDWEPISALDGGKDGLDYFRKIIPESVNFLKQNGILIFEHGDGQSREVSAMLSNAGFKSINAMKDYSGKERVIQARWTK